MSTRTHITLPEDLYKRLEAARGDVPRSRFIVRAVEKQMDRRAGKANADAKNDVNLLSDVLPPPPPGGVS